MKSPREINELIEARAELHDIIEEKLKFLDKLDRDLYDLNDEFENLVINIKDGKVSCEKEQYRDEPYTSISFPIEWLSWPNSEIEFFVKGAKARRLEEERLREISRNEAKRRFEETKERKELERLKAKYG